MALYTHCAGHSLNLAILSSCSIPCISNCIDQIKSLTLFVKHSPKREGLLKAIVSKKTEHTCTSNTECAKKTPGMVCFTPDRLSKTEVKRLSNGLLNGPQTGAERTVHSPFRFMYVAHPYVRINELKNFYLRSNSNSASCLPV